MLETFHSLRHAIATISGTTKEEYEDTLWRILAHGICQRNGEVPSFLANKGGIIQKIILLEFFHC